MAARGGGKDVAVVLADAGLERQRVLGRGRRVGGARRIGDAFADHRHQPVQPLDIGALADRGREFANALAGRGQRRLVAKQPERRKTLMLAR